MTDLSSRHKPWLLYLDRQSAEPRLSYSSKRRFLDAMTGQGMVKKDSELGLRRASSELSMYVYANDSFIDTGSVSDAEALISDVRAVSTVCYHCL